MEKREFYEKMFQSVLQGEIEEAGELAKKALEVQIDPIAAINKGYVKGMDEVGRLYQTGEYFLPELVAAGEAMKTALKILDPVLKEQKTERKILGRVVLGTVEGDIHDIGKSIVGSMLVATGFEVVDLGVNVSIKKFLDTVKEVKPDILGLSALLTTTMPNQKKVIEALEEAKERQDVKVMVGGAAVTNRWATEIGADAYGEDAITAVELAKKLAASLT
ncbi:corrinoid protein [Candidatus Aerophobetes bacterium]|nr:corrinoid protein [Candidatus Aerophobetes bacterium]